MKIIPYTDVQATHYKSTAAQGLAARVVIGKKDGADNFCMRVFEFSPGGHSPRHTHDWEHKCSFIRGGAKFSATVNGIPSRLVISPLSPPMKNIK